MKQRHAKKEVSGAVVVFDCDPAHDRMMSSGLTQATQGQKWRDVAVAKVSQRGKESMRRGQGLVADKKSRRSILLFWYILSFVIAIGVFLGSKNNVTVRRRAQLEILCEDRGRIIAGLFKANSNHVKSVQAFIETLNETNTAQPPSVLPSFSEHAPVCDFSVVPMVEERTVDEYVLATAFSRPLVDRIAYCVRVLHANRARFERCMGFEITDYHTKLRRSDQEDYVVRTHVPNTTYLHSFDILSISDFHKDMLSRARESDNKEAPTVSPPFPLLALNKMGLALAFAVRKRESAPPQTAAERDSLTIGYMVGTVDFETAVELVISTVQQGSGKYDRVLTRLDDVSDPAHPIPLYEPHDAALQSKRVTPAGLIPDNGTQIAWTLSNSQLLRDKDWFVSSVDIGDAQRRHELRCQYEVADHLPGPALLAGVGSLLIALLLLQVIWGAISRLESMRVDYIRIAQLKQAADAGNTAKSLFLATMTHEIRTPLTGMLGMVNLLAKTALDPMQLDYVRTAEQSGRSLFYLINDVLDFAKIESGHLGLEAFSFNMRSLVDEVLGALSSQAEAKKGKVELAALVFDTVPRSVVGDPARLRQVLISILGNALKFTERGHVFLTVRLKEGERQGTPSRGPSMRSDDDDLAAVSPQSSSSAEKGREGGGRLVSFDEEALQTLSGRETADDNQTWAALTWSMKEGERAKAEQAERRGQTAEGNLVAIRKRVKVVFTIEDTGVGIPEGSKDRIFEPFQQLHSSMERRYWGTGIGLALSQRLVELMGGSIDYVSKPRVGSTFMFDCQLDVFEKPKALSVSVPGGFSSRPWPVGGWDPPSASKLSGKRAVLVDKGLVRQQVLAAALRLLGLQVDFCDSLYTALFAIQNSVMRSVEAGEGEREENKEWDLVLVDEQAAGPGTGIEFGQLLMRSADVKNAVRRGGRVPKLLLVAYSLSDEETEVAQRGYFGGVVEKPIRSNVLAHTLQESLGFLPSPGPFGKNTAAVRQLQMLNDILKDKRVLVADDNMVSGKVTSATMLELGAAAVVTVMSGQEAVGKMVPPHAFDCVFLDMMLPDMDGYEITRRIRALEEEAGSTLEFPKRVPILAVMADVGSKANVEGEEAGLDAYMQKPVTEQQLVVVLLRIFCPPKASDKGGGRGGSVLPSSPRRGNADGQSTLRQYGGRSELSRK